VRGKTRRQR